MQIKFERQKEKYKIPVIAILLAVICFATILHEVFESGMVFTHFFYIPIILVSLWWKRKGLVVAIFLGGLLIFNHIVFRHHVLTLSDYFRALMFIVVAFVVGGLSERIAKAEERIKLAYAELSQIFHTAADGMRVIDKNFNVLRVNETFSTLSGTSEDESMGKKCYEVFHGPPCHTPNCSLTRILDGEKRVECEVEKERNEDIRIPCILTATPFRRPGGKLIGVVESFKDITERKETENEIKASLKQKEVLLKEIHHRVKNNLQVVSSLLDFQSEHIKDKEAIEAFSKSQDRIRVMALLHEKLCQSGDLARVNIAEHIRDLISYLFHLRQINADTIILKTHVDDIFLSIDVAIPCGLIVSELVSNCLKHAFPQDKKGTICIDLWSDKKGKLALIVRDNGVGIPKHIDFRKTKSLGLQLVNMLVYQLRGSIELGRSGGTVFKITFAGQVQLRSEGT